MDNNERFADQFCNIALMYSLVVVDRRILLAFDEDDHATVAECADMFQHLTDQICEFVAADNV